MIGALTLTLAAITLISGVWCYALSPTTDYTKHIDAYEYPLTIEGFASKSITFPAERGETIDISIRASIKPPPPPIYEEVTVIAPTRPLESRFDVKFFDPEGELIWQMSNVTHSYLRTKALKSNAYKVEVKNLSAEIVTIPIYITRSLKTTVRPLEPAGQWLSLISLPIFGFGIWMLIAGRKREKATT